MLNSHFRRSAGVMVTALLTAGIAAAQTTDRLPVHYLTRADGLPSVQNHDIAQARDGRIWIAGPSGLARYDGQRLTMFGKSRGLAKHGLRALALAPDGRLFVGSDTGIDIISEDDAVTALSGPDWRHGFVESIAFDSVGNTWFGTSAGLLLLPAGTDSTLLDAGFAGQLVASVAAVGDSILIAGPQLGVHRYHDGSWQQMPAAGWLQVAPVRTLAAGPGSTVFVGGDNGFLHVDVSGKSLHEQQGPGGVVTAILYDNEDLWVAIDGSLRLYRTGGEHWRRYVNVASHTLVNRLVRDDAGNIWVATDDRGVMLVTVMRRAVMGWPAPCDTQVFSLHKVSTGLLVSGDSCSWISDPVTGQIIDPLPELNGLKIWDTVQDHEGVIWAASEQGLLRLGRELQTVGGDDAVLGAPGRVLLNHGNSLLAGTVKGLARVENGRISEIVDAQGQGLGYVYTLQQDNRGAVWVGTIGRGVWILEGNIARQVSDAHLTSDDSVYAIAFDDKRQVIVAGDRIVIRVGDDESTVIKSPTDETVAGWSALFGADGTLYIGSSSGLLQIDPVSQNMVRQIDGGLGIAGEEFTTSRSLFAQGDHLLWAGTAGGLTRIDTATFYDVIAAPEIKLASVQWSNTEPVVQQDESLEIASGRWSVSIQMYSPWYANAASVLFRHQLLGFDNSWSAPVSGAEVHYTALPAGSYQLQAQAWSPINGWGPVATVFEFAVRPPWWTTPMARLLFVAIITLLALGILQWRTARLRQRSRKLELLVEERTIELVTANEKLARAHRLKDMTLSTVTHDLRNPLGAMAGLITVARTEGIDPAKRELVIERMGAVVVRMLHLVNDLLEIQRGEAGQLSMVHEDVDIAAFLTDVTDIMRPLGEKKQIDLVLQLADLPDRASFDPERMRQVLENLIGNAYKFSHSGTRVTVSATSVNAGILRIVVTDQGQGIPQQQRHIIFEAFERSSTTATAGEHGAGLGLAICQRIVTLHHGTLTVESEVGQGSRFEINLPIN